MPLSHSTEAPIKVTEVRTWEARLLSRKVMLPLRGMAGPTERPVLLKEVRTIKQ